MAKYSKEQNSAPKGQDKLVDISGNKVSPVQAKPSDWPKVDNPVGENLSLKNKVVSLSVTQEGPRHCEDDGPGAGYGTPVPGDRSRIVSSHYPVGKSHADEGTSVKGWKCSVNLETGQMEPPAVSQRY